MCQPGLKKRTLRRLAYCMNRNVLVCSLCCFVCVLLLSLEYSVINSKLFIRSPPFIIDDLSLFYKGTVTRGKSSSSYTTLNHQCPSVLPNMLNGKWLKRDLNESEETEIERFLLSARNGHLLPKTLQRSDGKCGNVTFDWLRFSVHPSLWFRALCNPKGDKPCCRKGFCVAASEMQCQCENCYDMRQQIHAEYSKWIPTDSKCRPKEFSHAEACELLKGSSLHFIGDSFVRHVYTALLLLLKNDFQHGAMRRETSASIKAECEGMYMFTEKVCRMWLDRSVSACEGTVRVHFKEQIAAAYGSNFPRLAKSLAHTDHSMLILGIGIHEDYTPSSTIKGFLNPLITYLRKSQQVWPKVLWTGPHAPGLLKTPRIPKQNYQSVLRYNSVVNKYLDSAGVPVMDTFNMTDGVMSFDGAHYGLGVNTMKVQILLNYVQELTDKRLW